MEEYKLGMVESHFADIIWANEPLTTKELVNHCEKELNWKRTTTYTVLKKLCDRGIFKTEQSVVSSLIKKEEFYQTCGWCGKRLPFHGSLPAFIAAFSLRKKPSREEIEEIKKLIDSYEK